MQKVLRDDREKLRQMQKSQPRFTKDQRRELVEVHPWMKRGGLPKAIDVKVTALSPPPSAPSEFSIVMRCDFAFLTL